MAYASSLQACPVIPWPYSVGGCSSGPSVIARFNICSASLWLHPHDTLSLSSVPTTMVPLLLAPDLVKARLEARESGGPWPSACSSSEHV